MDADQLKNLKIPPATKRRPQRPLWIIFLLVGMVTVGALYFAWPRATDQSRKSKNATDAAGSPALTGVKSGTSNSVASTAADDSVLTVNGYIINRQRIEISPRFMGVVKWIGVKKGDAVTNGQVVVLLDDAEYRARLHQAQAQLDVAKTAVAKAELMFQRVTQLAQTETASKQAIDDARMQLEADRAAQKQSEGELELAQTYVDWCVIRAPINGVVLAKLVEPDELVMPQSFGGARGPSTALVALADPRDLQVEIDVNEADLSKIFMGQRCRVSPEAYADKIYNAVVAEIAPEADRAKGTLQIKVQIENPDRFLTPELSAKVDFLKNSGTH